MLYGCDMSKWQTLDKLDAAKEKSNLDFVICKATEGKGFKDPTFHGKIRRALQLGMLIGAYHFCRPDLGNSAESEAINFVTEIQQYKGKILLAADWEGSSCDKDKGGLWVKAWCDKVFDLTGVRPLVYCSQSRVKDLTAFTGSGALNYGLWVAKWSNTEPAKEKIKPWKFWAIWQYSNKPYDLDKFNGDANQWEKYCLPIMNTPGVGDAEGKCHCGCMHCCEEDDIE